MKNFTLLNFMHIKNTYTTIIFYFIEKYNSVWEIFLLKIV